MILLPIILSSFISLNAFSMTSFNSTTELNAANIPNKATNGSNSMSQPTRITSNDIPNSIQYEAKFQDGYKWKDLNGEQIVFLTETGVTTLPNVEREYDESQDVEFYLYIYKLENNTPTRTSYLYDYLHDCPLDIFGSFTPNTLKITDLNNDGYAEVWTMYSMTCAGDLSPFSLTLVMYENGKKYEMRGESRIKLEDELNNIVFEAGGEFEMDAAFEKAPVVFKDYAKKLWEDNYVLPLY